MDNFTFGTASNENFIRIFHTANELVCFNNNEKIDSYSYFTDMKTPTNIVFVLSAVIYFRCME